MIIIQEILRFSCRSCFFQGMISARFRPVRRAGLESSAGPGPSRPGLTRPDPTRPDPARAHLYLEPNNDEKNHSILKEISESNKFIVISCEEISRTLKKKVAKNINEK